MDISDALIVFAREPLPGRVKSRLAASIGDFAATELYEKMLRDVLKTCGQTDDCETVVFWDCDDTPLSLLADRYAHPSRKQTSGDLGHRMQSAFVEMFAEGREACCIIGSDTPDLPASFIQKAFRLLNEDQADAVFGPTEDGGYYLLGLKRLWPQLFSNIDWSTQKVLKQSLETAERSGIRAALLPEWYDIDTVHDLEKYSLRNRISTEYGIGGM